MYPQNGTFVGPTLMIPMMMFSGFGVRIVDIPKSLQWGTTFSYLRYSLEGYISAIYSDRPTLQCDVLYCHYKFTRTFLKEINMPDDRLWFDIAALVFTLALTKVCAYLLLRWKICSMRWNLLSIIDIVYKMNRICNCWVWMPLMVWEPYWTTYF